MKTLIIKIKKLEFKFDYINPSLTYIQNIAKN